MRCSKCGTEVSKNTVFCPKCGEIVLKKKKRNLGVLHVIMIMIVAVFAVGAFVIFPQISANSQQSRLNEKLTQGNNYLLRKDYDNALTAFREAIVAEPNQIDAYAGLAKAYLGKDEYEKASNAYETAMKYVEQRYIHFKSLPEGSEELYLTISEFYLKQNKTKQSQNILNWILNRTANEQSKAKILEQLELINEDVMAENANTSNSKNDESSDTESDIESDTLTDTDIITDTDTNNPKQWVCQSELYYDIKKGTSTETKYEYDKNKRMISETNSDGEGVVSTTKYTYDTRGNKVKAVDYDSDDTILNRYSYSYDTYGNEIDEIVYDSKDAVLFTYKYDYNENQNLIEVLSYDADKKTIYHMQTEYDVDGQKSKDTWYLQDGTVSDYMEYTFDSKGNLTLAVDYDSKNNINYQTTYEYDSKDQLIMETQTYEDGSVSTSYKYEYDTNGNMTLKACYDGDNKQVWLRKFSYDNI